jgi:HK97 family phage major capsid protein
MAINTTLNGPKGLYPDATFIPNDIVPDALINELTTQTVVIEGDQPVVRVPFVAEDATVGFVAEGELIPTADARLSEVLVHTQKLAVISRMSRESTTYDSAAEFVSASMARAVTVKANNALLSNESNPTGLIHTPGLIDGGTLADGNLDVLSDAITTIEANGATATHLTMDPKSWGELRKLKTATGSSQLLLGAPADQTDKRLFGISVIVTPQMPEGTILVSDKSNIVSSAGGIQLTKSAEAYFDRDSYGYRVTWRFGWNVIRPERLAKVTVSLA